MRTVVKSVFWGVKKSEKTLVKSFMDGPFVYLFLIMFELDQVRRNGYENL